MRRDFLLGSSICWFASSCFFVHEACNSKAASFDREKKSRFLLKESILHAMTEDKDAREEIWQGCKILARLNYEDHAGPTVEFNVQRTLSTLTSGATLDMIEKREGSSSLG
jgi:hypothetical protein